jgi:hypothetical protein
MQILRENTSGSRMIQWKKTSLFNKCTGTTRYPHAKELGWALALNLDKNAKAKSIKFVEENMGANLCDLGLGNGYLGIHKQQKY